MKQPNKLPSLDYLREAIDYCPIAGTFRWKQRPVSHFSDGAKYPAAFVAQRWNAKYAGTEAGNYNAAAGYLRICIDYVSFKAHRLAWMLGHGADPSGPIDHVDGDTRNNSLANLRVVTASQNQRNQPKRSDNKSGACGVFYQSDRKKWLANIRFGGRTIHLGRFDTFVEACAARAEADRAYGFHENHGRDRPTQRIRNANR